jgi:hypothetical protein
MIMEGTDSVSRDARELVTLWMCTGCLKRFTTTRFNPRWIDVSKVVVKPFAPMRRSQRPKMPAEEMRRYNDRQNKEDAPSEVVPQQEVRFEEQGGKSATVLNQLSNTQ